MIVWFRIPLTGLTMLLGFVKREFVGGDGISINGHAGPWIHSPILVNPIIFHVLTGYSIAPIPYSVRNRPTFP